MLLDKFTYAVVALIIVYILLWILEYYDKQTIDMNKTKDCIHDKITDNKPLTINKEMEQQKKGNKK